MATLMESRSSSEQVEHLDIPVEHSPTLDHPIRVRSRPVPYGVRIALHTHPWAQVAYTSRGVLRVATTDSTWMVPPSRAIWVPPNVTHEVVIVEDAYLRTLYVDASVVPAGLGACRVVEVSPLLREVIAALDEVSISRQRERLLGTLALDEIIRSQPLPPNEAIGYQADMGDPEWWGCLYDESRRDKVRHGLVGPHNPSSGGAARSNFSSDLGCSTSRKSTTSSFVLLT